MAVPMSTPKHMVEATTPFKYTPLDTALTEIRLLWIPQSTPQSDIELHLSLTHFSLQKAPDFVALSYCWGGPSLDRPVSVNGSQVLITESLETALLSLRCKDGVPPNESEGIDEPGFFLWADAICINQSDDVEKTSQVQIMRYIYKAAIQVLIWLGPSTTATDEALGMIQDLGNVLLSVGILDLVAEKRKDLLPWIVQPQDGTEAARIRMDIITILSAYKQAALAEDEDLFCILCPELANRPWFRRVWCIQECVNARTATFRCGNSEIDYQQAAAVNWFWLLFNVFISGGFHNYNSDTTVVKRFLHAVDPIPRSILDLRSQSLHNTELSLRDLLQSVSMSGARYGLNATDDRDRVYALLSVATDEAARCIIPDYTLTCHNVYVNTARVLLDCGHFDILSLCRQSQKYNLPSWTPDWSLTMDENWSMPPFRPLIYYNACGHLNKQLRRLSVSATVSRKLDLDSIIVDTINELGACYTAEICQDGPDRWPDLKHYFCDLRSYLARSEIYSADQKKEAEWRIPIADMEWHAIDRRMTRPSGSSWMAAGYAGLKDIHGWSTENSPFDPQLSTSQHLSSQASALVALISHDSPCYHYTDRLRDMYGTRPFLSANGYVGLCPEETAPDDKIVIFAGAKLPYITRLNSDGITWRLVGEAYVHLIMDGEFVSASSQTEVITLQ